jgi:hypothetical protein
MKNITLCITSLLMSSAANAGVVTVATHPIPIGGNALYLVFNYNDRGRAWIEEKDTNGPSSDFETRSLHFHLPGLRFDGATREILYGRAVCAKVVPMGFGYSVYSTGQCVLSTVRSSRSYETDDGTKTSEFETVLMSVR